jgi:hypothetical protein
MTQENNTPVQEATEAEAPVNPNLRITKAPLQGGEIREYFDNKELFYLLNYSQGTIKGAQFLVYTTNLELPCDVTFDWPLGYAEYEQIMLAYMNQNSVTRMLGLHVMAAQMLLLAKGFTYEQIPYTMPVYEKVIVQFIETHKDQVLRWLHFIDSTQVFALQSIERLRNHYNPRDVFDVVDDRSYVGANVAGLFGVAEFIGTYFCASEYRLSYFSHQFESYMFKGAHLSKYFNHQNNLAAVLFPHYAIGTFVAGDMENSLFKIGVFSEKMDLPEYVYDPNHQPAVTGQPPSPPIPDAPKPPEASAEAVQDGQPVVDQSE